MKVAKQGHRFDHKGQHVLAYETGAGLVRVAPIDDSQPYPLGKAFIVEAADLVALPMAYFFGEIPK